LANLYYGDVSGPVHPVTVETIPAFVGIPNRVHQDGREDSCGFGAWRATPNSTDVIVKGCNRSDFFFAETSPHVRAVPIP
jgi:hypothetical protein